MKITDLLESPIDMTGDPNDPTIYGHEKANPMSLKGRIQQARNQLKELAELADSDDLVAWERITQLHKGGMFMGLAQNLEQVRHGIEELAAKRKQGGVASRGIDKTIGERSVSQAQARLMAASAHNPEFAKKVGMKQSVAKEFNKADTGKSIKSLPKHVEEAIPFAGAKVGQKPADQVRGTDRAKKISTVLGAKPKKHPFDGKLVGGGM
jgi:hypothetical protein